ncbi:MAG TPA: glucose-6-phosphate isomerase [Solirubrobacteraceae bacterium]|nr:glucose-6-phosphate isomerase [Solirubrobacteraceae bacterium]
MSGGRPLDELPAFAALREHERQLRGRTVADLFAADPRRGEVLRAQAAGIYLDYAKQRVTGETLELLVRLAEEAGLPERIEAMFAGARINVSEGRAVLHVALRAPRGERMLAGGEDVVGPVHEVLDRMAAFSDRVRSGAWTGATGRPIRNVVNIGIGGSHLGPEMATLALASRTRRDMRFRFVSNVDGSDFAEQTQDLDPAQTLFVVVSKTFTTLETLTNAATARAWVVGALGEEAVARHFVAVSTNAERVSAFGIDPQNMFGFWDWVGGRYSMDSAVGLSIMLAIGPQGFGELLAGFRAIDEHLRCAPLAENLPVLLGLLSVWNATFLGMPTVAVLPYAAELSRFPAYLQQLEMESNGKHVMLDGSPVRWPTGPVLWGEPGTNGQHAFYQLMHQGTQIVPAEFIGFTEPVHQLGRHHDLLLANMLAQAEALAFGRDAEALRAAGGAPAQIPHRVCEGDRPSSTILVDGPLTPAALGKLVALYEHRVLTEGVIWGIDSFDQWGVELGKVLAGTLAGELEADAAPPLAHDSSTNALVRRCRAARGRAV